MPTIPTEAYRYFEQRIYLPMVITILERDKTTVTDLPLKLPRPYEGIIDKALSHARADLKTADAYLIKRDMRLVKLQAEDDTQLYILMYANFEEHRRIPIKELRDKTEVLITEYLRK
jgi:hypothetical protein